MKKMLLFLILIVFVKLFANTDKSLNPVFSHEAGFYDAPFFLELSTTNKNAKIYYTLDGSEPIPGFENTFLYNKPIKIEDRRKEKNVYSMIKTSVLWNPPKGSVYKGTIIRAKAFSGNASSKTITKTYFIGQKDKYTFPVISIVSEPENLFDYDKGIYVLGKSYYDDEEESEEFKGNFHKNGKEWEREVHFEFFENGELKYEDDLGVRIHGGFTASFPLKSLRLYARDKYGKKKIRYPIFPDLRDINGELIENFDKLILRNGGNDFQETFFRDALIHELVKNLGFDVMAFRPAVHFINGEYWGIINIRERYDTDYIEEHYGVPEKKVVILEVVDDPESNIHFIVDEGKKDDNKAFLELKRFIVDYNMDNPANYNYVKSKIDIDNYIKYVITEIYVDNRDWPGNNIRLWRKKSDFNEKYGHDGKWRFMLFDTDNALFLYDYNTLKFSIDGDPDVSFPNPIWSTEMLKNLLENNEFKEKFIITFMDLLNTTFSVENTIPLVNKFINLYKPEIKEHIFRWNFPESYEYWLYAAEYIKTFFKLRPKYIIDYLKKYFNLKSIVEFSIKPVEGKIKINSIVIEDEKKVKYFSGIPIKIYPISNEESEFKYWEINGEKFYDKKQILLPEKINSIKAVFESVK